MTMRKVYLALLWYVLGVISVMVLSVYVASQPITQTMTDQLYAPPPSTFKPVLVKFDYTYPISMTVGDVSHVRMHITNYHIYTTPTAALTPPPLPVDLALVTSSNCTAVENSTIPGAHQILEPAGTPTAFDWTISATGPGECNLEFRSTIGTLMKPDPVIITIRDRWGSEQQATILAGLLIGLPGLVGMFRRQKPAA
jgi:hypothetical protein